MTSNPTRKSETDIFSLQSCRYGFGHLEFICTKSSHSNTTIDYYILLLPSRSTKTTTRRKINTSSSMINTGEKQISDSKLHPSVNVCSLCNNRYCGELVTLRTCIILNIVITRKHCTSQSWSYFQNKDALRNLPSKFSKCLRKWPRRSCLLCNPIFQPNL